jgi:hypothetical protein
MNEISLMRTHECTSRNYVSRSTKNQQQIVGPPSCSGRVGLDSLQRIYVDPLLLIRMRDSRLT